MHIEVYIEGRLFKQIAIADFEMTSDESISVYEGMKKRIKEVDMLLDYFFKNIAPPIQVTWT